jgi:hypothetical protein
MTRRLCALERQQRMGGGRSYAIEESFGTVIVDIYLQGRIKDMSMQRERKKRRKKKRTGEYQNNLNVIYSRSRAAKRVDQPISFLYFSFDFLIFLFFLSFLTYTFPIGVPFLFMYLLLLRFVAAVKEKRSPRLIHFYGQSRQDAAVYTYVLHYRLYFFFHVAAGGPSQFRVVYRAGSFFLSLSPNKRKYIPRLDAAAQRRREVPNFSFSFLFFSFCVHNRQWKKPTTEYVRYADRI